MTNPVCLSALYAFRNAGRDRRSLWLPSLERFGSIVVARSLVTDSKD